ncbi:hypothetical protein SAPIO_CDS4293 [Scedosporium apiospermum]|uniref:NACHT domain-containing protein n=1 Tax=Pseudallescheria apiosperma TaxID=563466 RepID=A0A084G8L6_PSEDA|nr:uncharacterized protein SAPIO_CDS4293 [Scedosporium apiospermum]KEZ43678.1 hypothetical protein SAPIO_CDS4293 [Scedosporium apiospermum]
MDPASAIGLASSIITFIEFSCKVVTIANELYESNNGMTKENARILKVIGDLKESSLGLKVDTGSSSKHDVALQDLAKECESTSGELIAILEKLKLASQSKRERLKKAFDSQRKRKAIASLESRLGEYRNQMGFRLLCLLNEETSTTKKQLDVVQAASKKLDCASSAKLEDIRRELISLLSPLQDANLLSKINEKLQSLQAVVKSTDRETRILEHLHFETIHTREDSIEDAPYETFRWILDSEDNNHRESNPKTSRHALSSSPKRTGDEDVSLPTTMKSARELLQNWLSSGTGVFHISGKAGSGKSTLMKLLCTHRRTHELLRSWVGDRKLIFARFYFWNPGSDLQKSLDGLYRSILFHVLRQCPQLIPSVFPDQWEQLSADDSSSRRLEVDLFRPPQIKKAFDGLIQTSLDSENIAICLFIDGLDEYNAKAYDHRLLAERICRWAVSKNVKICVSSRPHVEFVDTFDKRLRINLHDLTAQDITRLGCRMFENSSNFSRIKETYYALVEEIVSLAEGVFLWAHLVLKSIISEVALYSSYKRLRQKIRSMPRELDELYDKILGGMEPDDRTRANLLLLLMLSKPFSTLSPIYFAGLEITGITTDPDFPSDGQVIPFMLEEDYHVQCDIITRQISSLTRGLLVVTTDPSLLLLDTHPSVRIDFFHRTVQDYLETPRRLTELLEEFANIDLLQLHGRLKLVPIIRYIHEELRNGFEQRNVSSAVFPATTDARGLNALLSAALGAANPSLSDPSKREDFTRLLRDPDDRSYAMLGGASESDVLFDNFAKDWLVRPW